MKPNRGWISWVSALLLVAVAAGVAVAAVPQEGMQLWLRADVGVELLQGEIVRWVDQSGQKNHAYGEPGTAPAVKEHALNGLPVVVFDGTTDFLAVPHSDGLNADAEFTLFVVYLYEKGFELNRVMQKRSNVVGIGVDGWYVAPARGAAVAGVRESTDLFAAGEFLLHTAVFDANAGTMTLIQDGAVVSVLEVKAPQTPNAHPLFIGKREHTSPAHFAGQIAEIIVYNKALTDSARMQVESYLKQKYGL